MQTGRYYVVERHPRHPFVYRSRIVGGSEAMNLIINGGAKYVTKDKPTADRVAVNMTTGIRNMVNATATVVD
jgi:hypothetical protein